MIGLGKYFIIFLVSDVIVEIIFIYLREIFAEAVLMILNIFERLTNTIISWKVLAFCASVCGI